MNKKLLLLFVSAFFLVSSFLGVIILSLSSSKSVIYDILLSVFAGSIPLFPISLVDYLYEKKKINQKFIDEVNSFISKETFNLENSNNFQLEGYRIRAESLSQTIVLLNSISKKRGVIAQNIQSIILNGANDLNKNNDSLDVFGTIVSNVNAEIDKLV